MEWVGARRRILLTGVAPADNLDPWQTVRKKVNRTREYLTRMGIDPGLWASFVEPNPKGTGYHVHVTHRGDKPIPKEALQDAATRAGVGWTSINRLDRSSGWSAYVGKGFSTYVGKGFTDDATATTALRLNGGRLGHFSRGYFVSDDGEKIGVREAEKQAARAARTEEAGSWVLMREASAP